VQFLWLVGYAMLGWMITIPLCIAVGRDWAMVGRAWDWCRTLTPGGAKRK